MKGDRAETHRDENALKLSSPRRAAQALALAISLLAHAGPAVATSPTPAGTLPSELVQAFQQHLLDCPAPQPLLRTSAQQTDWLVPVILVSYSDSAMHYTPAQFQAQLFDTTHANPTGSVIDYYDWASGGRIHVRGEVVGTITVPGTRFYYSDDAYGVNAISTPNNDAGFVRDAVAKIDPQVDWSRYDRDGDGFVDMLWVVHPGAGGEVTGDRRNLWSLTSRLSAGWSNSVALETDDLVPGSGTQHIRVDRFTILPELSGFHAGALSEIGVYCHEFGHALGLPDLYDTSQLGGAANSGPGNWSLMSTGAYGGDGHSPQTPTDMGAWPRSFLGWTGSVRPTQDSTITLVPPVAGGKLVEFWFQGESNGEHFLAEARSLDGYDRNLPSPGLVLYQVDDVLMGARIASNRVNAGPQPALRVVEADGRGDLVAGVDRGDATDPFPGAGGRTHLDDDTSPSLRSMSGAVTNLVLDNVSWLGTSARATFRVRAPGWSAPQDVSESGYAPLDPVGLGRRAVVTGRGRISLVDAEPVNGISQIRLRTREWAAPWGASEVVTASTVEAQEPGLALLPGDDLALVWLDRRSGSDQVWYRARIGGTWTPETRLTSSPNSCAQPAMATDAHGRVFVTWLETANTGPTVKFMRFDWASPFGQAFPVSGPTELPGAPQVTAAPDGHAYVFWSDRSTGVPNLFFSRFTADSGLSARLRAPASGSAAQPTFDCLADADGTLHVVWQQTGSGLNEIHYQRRPALGAPSPRDTVIESLPEGVQEPHIARDLQGGVHMSYLHDTPDGTELRYKRWRVGEGWDYRATDVSTADEGAVARSALLAVSTGGVSLVYSGFDGAGEHLLQRDRRLDYLTAAVPALPAVRGPALRLGPDPLRAGEPLAVSGEGVRPGATVELFDASGRRLAETRVDGAGRAHFGGDVTRPLVPGLYFTRVRGAASGRLVVIR